MRGKGVTYDTGFFNGTVSTHEPFDPEVVAREMRIIRDDLNCTAVRVTGGDVGRLETAARHAAAAGLEVWLSPFTCDLTTDQLLELLADCARRAERLRHAGAAVVFVTGSEVSLFTQGFFPGDTIGDRLAVLGDPHPMRERLPAIPPLVNAFLERAVSVARHWFRGPLTYASIPFEGVAWTAFDIVATDGGYRSADVAAVFRDGIRHLVGQGKPVAITEFGCTTYRGSADMGARGDQIIEWSTDARPLRLDGDYIRGEEEQASQVRELFDIFEAEGVDSAFVSTFARFDLPHRAEPRLDLDTASYGVVKVLEDRRGDRYPDMAWEPKAAFDTIAEMYGGNLETTHRRPGRDWG